MNKNTNKCDISQKNSKDCCTRLHFVKVRMRCTDDGPSRGPNQVATLLKSDSCVGRNI